MQYSYSYLMEYLPVRYEANETEWSNRRAIWNLKDGHCSTQLCRSFANAIQNIIGSDNPNNWVVLFIPASSQIKTHDRFSPLAEYIRENTNVYATLNGIITNEDRASAANGGGSRVDHTSSYTFNSNIFSGKNVILIDDVITTGTSFKSCANRLIRNGAAKVVGLFAGKTINPDWQAA